MGEFKKVVKSPVMKELSPPNEENIKEEEVRKAQKDVGELLWLATRTRPDIAFVTSRMSQQILTAPRWVHNMAEVTWAYLQTTPELGLWFRKDGGVNLDGGSPSGLQAYSDISFSPSGDGSASHGAVYITWNGGLMLWRSSRQPFPTLSTAESELVESIEAFTIGDAVDTVLKEFEGPHGKRLLIDNAAAVALLGDGPSSWRTRHLKVRAQGLRWRITSLDWRISHVPGAQQIADVGTKPLAPQRLQELQVLMNMGVPPEDPTTEVKDIEGQLKRIRDVLRAGLVMSQIQGARASDGGHKEEELSFSWIEILILAVIYGFVMWTSIWVWEGLRKLRRVLMSRSQVYCGMDDLDEHPSGLARTGMRSRGARSRALDTGLFQNVEKEEISAGGEHPDQGNLEGAQRAMQRDARDHGARVSAGADQEPGDLAPPHGGRDLRAPLLPDGGERDVRAELPGDHQGGRDARDLRGLQGALLWQGPLLPTALDRGGEEHYDPVYGLEVPPVDPDEDFDEVANSEERVETFKAEMKKKEDIRSRMEMIRSLTAQRVERLAVKS